MDRLMNEPDYRSLSLSLLATLEGVLNSAAHPDIAYRAVLVNLAPVRKAITEARVLLGSSPH